MRALRSFTVRARLPEALAPLQDLALNLRWSWDERTRDLFRWVDPQVWETSFHDPVGLLGLVDRHRLETLAADSAFTSFLGEVHDDLIRSLDSPRWFQQRSSSPLRSVAYFSPEFGLAEAIPQYSGGLGVLAGDHLKAASSLGLPLTGVGLLYRYGYFRQILNADGWQEEHYPPLDPHQMALRLVERPGTGGPVPEPATISLSLDGSELTAQIWLVQIGRIKLYMLDTDIEANDDSLRSITDRLYGGGTEHRLRQEILLGIGGVRALDAVGVATQVFHTNEGHAGFLGLERIRRLIADEKLSWPEAIEAVRSGTLFTTHTPVPAGIDRFPRSLMEKYFHTWADECGVSIDTLMGLGHFPGEAPDAPFNMAVMGLRLAGMSNGVAKLHGKTSREMFAELWPSVPTEEVPIGSVTNGVHGRTWVSSAMGDLLSKYVSPAWEEAGPAEWARIIDAREDEVWRVREQGKEQLVTFVRARLRAAELARGVSEADTTWVDEVLDPRFLVVGFSRRFASYKRATLLLSQPERLRALLLDESRPLQLLFAGKAHPADDLGKEMISQLARFSRDPQVRHRITFVENYDISVARMLYQGSDVWLNTPRRPMEASGTSGEKAALNGALNCSILDGWWDEMFDGDNGWAIASAESETDVAQRDRVEANSLFEILERQILPLYYDRRGGERFPRLWVQRVQRSLASLGAPVLASRMVRDYVTGFYEPIAARTDALGDRRHQRARELAAWKRRVSDSWPAVKILDVGSDNDPALVDLGGMRTVTAEVDLGPLLADDVSVELLHGPVGSTDELADFTVVTMTQVTATSAAAGSSSAGSSSDVSSSVAAGSSTKPSSSSPSSSSPSSSSPSSSSPSSSSPSSAASTSGADHPSSSEAGAGAGPAGVLTFTGSFDCNLAGRHGYTVRVVPAHPDLATSAELGCVTWA